MGLGNRYARGHLAWGVCGRCGMRALLNELILDGYYPWLRVHDECYDSRHPQERLIALADPVALYRPSPEHFLPPSAPVISGAITLPIFGGTNQLAFTTSFPTLVGRVAANTASINITGTIPTLKPAIFPRTGTLTLTGYMPGEQEKITPHTAALALTGTVPTFSFLTFTHTGFMNINGVQMPLPMVAIVPPTGSLVMFGSGALRANTLTGSLLLGGSTPVIPRVPAVGSIALTGNAPTLINGSGFVPITGSLAVTGNAATRTP